MHELIERPKTEISTHAAERIARQKAEVEAHLAMAQMAPRNIENARTQILAACSNRRFAEVAMYAYPRGKKYDEATNEWVPNIVTGPSIRLMEEIKSACGRIKASWSVIDNSREDAWLVESYACDLQQLNYESVEFVVEFKREKWEGKGATRKKIVELITDSRDKYDHAANMAARRKRSCIERVVPWYLKDEAIQRVKETMAAAIKDPTPVAAGKKGTIGEHNMSELLNGLFKDAGLTKLQLEKHLGHKVDQATPDEIANLYAVLASVRSGEVKRAEFLSAFDEAKPLDVDTVEAATEATAAPNKRRGKATKDAPPAEASAEAPTGDEPTTPPPLDVSFDGAFQ